MVEYMKFVMYVLVGLKIALKGFIIQNEMMLEKFKMNMDMNYEYG